MSKDRVKVEECKNRSIAAAGSYPNRNTRRTTMKAGTMRTDPPTKTPMATLMRHISLGELEAGGMVLEITAHRNMGAKLPETAPLLLFYLISLVLQRGTSSVLCESPAAATPRLQRRRPWKMPGA